MSIFLRPLRTDQDWLKCQSEVEQLEKRCPEDCYQNWRFQYEAWKVLSKGNPAWLLGFVKNNELSGAMFLLESESVRRRVRFKTLRSMDFAVMHAPPMIVPTEYEKEAARALAVNRRLLARATGADLVTLYKLNKHRSEALRLELERRWLPHEHKTFNISYQIDLSEGVETYLKTKKRKSIYNIRRSMRLLEEAVGGELHLERYRGTGFGNPAFEAAWKSFEALREQSWQLEAAKNVGEKYPVQLQNFFSELVHDWGNRGWLDLVLLKREDRLLAGQVNAIIGSTQWVILMAFARDLSEFSPGRVLLYRQLADSYERGDRLIILGGESDSGKQFWANQFETTLELSWPLASTKAFAWSLMRLAKRGTPKVEVPKPDINPPEE